MSRETISRAQTKIPTASQLISRSSCSGQPLTLRLIAKTALLGHEPLKVSDSLLAALEFLVTGLTPSGPSQQFFICSIWNTSFYRHRIYQTEISNHALTAAIWLLPSPASDRSISSLLIQRGEIPQEYPDEKQPNDQEKPSQSLGHPTEFVLIFDHNLQADTS